MDVCPKRQYKKRKEKERREDKGSEHVGMDILYVRSENPSEMSHGGARIHH